MNHARIAYEHDKAAESALQARYWFYHGRRTLTDGDTLSAVYAVNAWRRKWDKAERHSNEAERLEKISGPTFPGVAP